MKCTATGCQTLDSAKQLTLRVLLINASWRLHQNQLRHAMPRGIVRGKTKYGTHLVCAIWYCTWSPSPLKRNPCSTFIFVCVEKRSELPLGDIRQKFKYHVVFQGNGVVKQRWEMFIFQDLGSHPDCMEALQGADCYAWFPGHCCQQDTEPAYIQSELLWNETWVAPPLEAWHEVGKIKGWTRPVVLLKQARFGYPDSGTYWELSALCAGGFKSTESSQSGYWPDRLKLFLVVDVDDFKLAGTPENMAARWKVIWKRIEVEEPMDANLLCDILSRREGNCSPLVIGLSLSLRKWGLSFILWKAIWSLLRTDTAS